MSDWGSILFLSFALGTFSGTSPSLLGLQGFLNAVNLPRVVFLIFLKAQLSNFLFFLMSND